MTRRLVVCLVGLFLLGLVWAALPAGGAVDGGTADVVVPQTTPDEFTDTVFRIRVYENRSARWTIVYSRPLANQSEIDAFEAFAADFNENRTELYSDFRTRAGNLVGFGRNATGREMNATDFAREASVRQLGGDRGFVEMSYRWTNFSRAAGDRVVVDDVFQGGMYVAAGQRLEFHRGPNVAFVDVTPAPDSLSTQGNLSGSASVTWFGERQFADRRPAVELAPRDLVFAGNGGDATATPSSTDRTTTDGATTTAAGAGDANPPGGSGQQFAILLAGIILLVAVGLGLAWYGGALPPLGGGDGASGGATSRAGGAGGAGGVGVSQEELLSDEDRVERLLQENGGRMKQVSIVEETEWSKSKVSMLLSEMEDDGSISKLRVGRENIISLAGQEPEAAGSPFDDE